MAELQATIRGVKLSGLTAAKIAAAVNAANNNGYYKPLPSGVGMLGIGDSITFGTNVDTNFSRLYGIMLVLGGNVHLYEGYNQGIGGNKTADVLARIDTIGSYIQPLVTIQIGTNDISSLIDVDTYMANVRSIITKLFYYGAKRIIVHGIPDRGVNATNAWDDTHRALRTEYHNALGNLVMDNVIVDVASGEDIVIDDTTAPDNIHPNFYGSLLLGALQAKAIAKALTVEPVATLPNVSTDNLFTNPLLTGTGGNKSNTSGVVVDSWSCTSTANGASVTCSVESDVFGDGTVAQKAAVSGNNPSVVQIVQFAQTVTIPAAAAGDVYEFYCRFKVADGHSGIANVEARSDRDFDSVNEGRDDTALTFSDEFEGIICSAVTAPLSGGETSIAVTFRVRLLTGDVNAEIYWDSPVMRKLN